MQKHFCSTENLIGPAGLGGHDPESKSGYHDDKKQRTYCVRRLAKARNLESIYETNVCSLGCLLNHDLKNINSESESGIAFFTTLFRYNKTENPRIHSQPLDWVLVLEMIRHSTTFVQRRCYNGTWSQVRTYFLSYINKHLQPSNLLQLHLFGNGSLKLKLELNHSHSDSINGFGVDRIRHGTVSRTFSCDEIASGGCSEVCFAE
ncbi:hypothetical protein TorRG33x02_168200 [Trema orientale]|uniref:Uncharacterized protein n=1 Tax=Trema orientale TaxID=63057 RepID=A0A2P5EP26_TREOI|nr:hypothetical protein TorRG33x02_168200 [Trema orientale]